MGGLKENIENLTNTKGLEDLLIALAYWIGVIAIVLFIFYVVIKINNYVQQKKSKKPLLTQARKPLTFHEIIFFITAHPFCHLL